MTTNPPPVPTNQNCPGCGALVFYEGHSELKSTFTPHRFHCHRCGRAYIVRSTTHKPPRFRITASHEVQDPEAAGEHDHGDAGSFDMEEEGMDDDIPSFTIDAAHEPSTESDEAHNPAAPSGA